MKRTPETLAPEAISNNDLSPISISPIGISGYGQNFTTKYDTRKSYTDLTYADIVAMAEHPQEVDKAKAQWLIPSTFHHRDKSEQLAQGQFHALWLDIDDNPPTLANLTDALLAIVGCVSMVVYTSRSAKAGYQKARAIIPIAKSIGGSTFELLQEVLNDHLQAKGITPDRASERCNQVCYLPNRGEHYDYRIINGDYLDTDAVFGDDLPKLIERNNAAEKATQERIETAKAKREQRLAQGFDSIIDAFNSAFVVEDILLQSGYDQRGSKFRHPYSESGSFSASVKDGRVHSLSSSDPLYTGGGGGGAHDAFSAFKILFHGGDENAALKDAGYNWLIIEGESWNKVKQREYAQKQSSDDFSIVTEQEPSHCGGLDLLRKLTANGKSQELEAQMMTDTYVMKDLAIQGQWTVFYASPNTGKTLLSLWLLIEQIKAGEVDASKIYYVNVDDTFKGGTTKLKLAEFYGFNMLLPSVNGFKKEMIVQIMKGLTESNEAKGVVIILDTLKKFTNLMDKAISSDFGSVARSFIEHNGSIICLAHTNKKKDEEGKSVFGGTSDIVDDADCAYIVDSRTSPILNGAEHTVTFDNIKSRGDVAAKEVFTFTKSVGQTYEELLESVERLSESEIKEAERMAAIQKDRERDADLIAAIRAIIPQGKYLKTELVRLVAEDTAATKPAVSKVLKRWEGHLWQCEKGDKNAKTYSLTNPFKEISLYQDMAAGG